jgi:hypothetical protein
MRKRRSQEKRILSTLMLLVLIAQILASPVLVAASDEVAYIFRNERMVDENVVGVFEDMGLTVDLIDETEINNFNLESYRFLFIGDERYRHYDDIPVDKYPSIVSNYYFGDEWGFTDWDGVSKLGSNSPLSVKEENSIIQVYDRATFPSGGVSIPYYYLAEENKATDFDQIVSTYTGAGSELGDVISYATPGAELINDGISEENICFFGIIESDYWTSAAVRMFEDCVDFVGVSCNNEGDCPDSIKGDIYCDNGKLVQDIQEYTCENPGTVQSECVNDDIQEIIENCNYGCDEGECLQGIHDIALIDFNNAIGGIKLEETDGTDILENPAQLMCNTNYKIVINVENQGDFSEDIDFNGDIGGLSFNHISLSGFNPGTDTLKTKTVNFGLSEGTYNIDVEAVIDGNVDEELIDNTAQREIVVICPECFNDLECDDSDSYTNDICENPGTDTSVCVYEDINCILDSDCGTNGLVGDVSCSEDNTGGDLVQDYEVFSCENSGTTASSCSSISNSQLIVNCEFGCSLDSCWISTCEDIDLDGYDNCDSGDIGDDKNEVDCVDTDWDINPGAEEMCNGLDDNCDGLVDEENGDCSQGYVCLLGDCFEECIDQDGDGYDNCEIGEEDDDDKEVDCDDSDIWINPGRLESCDFKDNNCDGIIDENCCSDSDIDGFDDCSVGDPGDEGKELDCDDNDDKRYPENEEICDGLDNDCDGTIDEGNSICGIGNACAMGTCEVIECEDESDCGNDGFINGLFCDGPGNHDIYQDYIDYTCEEPGTISSSCSSSVDQRLVTDCLNSCEDGSCFDIVCEESEDCEDSNDHTFDLCVNPGEIDSHCTHGSIECLNNLECNDLDEFTEDTCINPRTVDSNCIYDEIVCFNNENCGNDGFINGLFCEYDNLYQNYMEWTCEDSGTISSSCTQTVTPELVTDCVDGCEDGSCFNIVCSNDLECDDGFSDTTDTCMNPGEIDSYCTHDNILCNQERDCGVDRFTGGLFCEDEKSIYRNFIDFTCNFPGDSNSYCSNDIDSEFIYECMYACSDGNCIRCNTDLECEDEFDFTEDSCMFAGTIGSYCRHQVIACSDDLECGMDGYFGAPYCGGPGNDNVYQNYKEFSCMISGEPGSYCEEDTQAQLIEECVFGCSGGDCSPATECQNGADDDSDYLIDAQDPGCWDNLGDSNSYNPNLDDESNGGIICINDIECGANDYIGDAFCSGGDVVQNYQIWDCLNPGTGLSECSDDSEERIIDNCGIETCVDATCVFDCVDDDSDGYDNCDFTQPDDDGNEVDCDDNDDEKYPGNEEICDGKDNDCDGLVDEGLTFDNDFDGFTSIDSCEGSKNDCDDNDDTVYPGAEELCDGIDNDCDSRTDEEDGDCITGWVCESGSCNEVDCENKGDCGSDSFVGDSYCNLGDVYQDFRTFMCNNPGTGFSSCNSDDTPQLVDDCVIGETCVDAACVFDCVDDDSDGYDNCDFTQPDDDGNEVDCDDNDDEKYPGNEEICDGKDNDCDGLVDEGSDICGSRSVCEIGTCIDVECYNDLECGIDGLIGSEFCSLGDVYQDFREFTCEEPGTGSSICSSDDTPQLVDDCTSNQVCDSGSCEEVECFDDLDCDDNEEYTKDTCHNPGTTSSSCSYEDIMCIIDSDCGTDGYVGDRFCLGDNVVQNYDTWNCLGSGTVSSSCDVVQSPLVMKTCTYGCAAGDCLISTCEDNDLDGFDNCDSSEVGDDGNEVDCDDNDDEKYPGNEEICDGKDNDCDGLVDEGSDICGGTSVCMMGVCESITCYIDSDCDDSDIYTKDTCHNPGTTSSSCTYETINCILDSDCGTDGYVGDDYCTEESADGNLVRDYQTWTCLDAGSVTSSCNLDLTQELSLDCRFGCFDDGCINSACADKADNDLDGFNDYPIDFSCSSFYDEDETNPKAECQDGIDNDGDGFTDLGDSGCINTQDNDESGPGLCLDEEVRIKVDFDLIENAGEGSADNSVILGNGAVYSDGEYFTVYESRAAIQDPDLIKGSSSLSIRRGNGYIEILGDGGIPDTSYERVHGTVTVDGGTIQRIIGRTATHNTPSELSSGQDLAELVDSDTMKFEFYYHVGGDGIIIVYDQNQMLCSSCVDNDGDGYDNCDSSEIGDDGNEVDCDDNDDEKYPGNEEICDGKDNDCDGLVDEGSDICGAGNICSNGQCVDDQRWIRAWNQNCNNACASAGMISVANAAGQVCTSGEGVVKEAVDELGTGIYLEGCWNNPGCSNFNSYDNAPNYFVYDRDWSCYRFNQKTDDDDTDIVAACHCRI